MDLRSLLDVDVSTIKKPPTWPAGPYHGFVEKYEPVESREKKTPGIRVFYRVQRASESIPADLLMFDDKPIDFAKRQLRQDFWLTEDSRYRLVEFLKAIGVDAEGEGKKLSQCLPEMISKPVVIQVGVRANSDNTELFNEVQSVVADA